jgi:tripartite-type tricarboxylate transporter receptor subunit TctC
MQRRVFNQAALAALTAGLAHVHRSASAADWAPTRPVRIIAGAPGSILDIFARQIAEKLAAALGQPVIVENKGGGGGVVAMETAASSPPDGHTVVITTFVEMTVNPWLYERLSYDPVRSFAPISMLYSGQTLLAAHPSFPADSLVDLIRVAKAQPGKYFYGSSGVARPPHIWVERFKTLAGIDIRHVPYKGAAPLTAALLTGEIPLAMEGAPALIPHVKAGKLKAIAVSGDRRLQALPSVPTFAESGFPAMGLTWVAVVAPAATPATAIARLNQEFVRVMTLPEVKAANEQAGRVVVASTPEVLAAAIRTELPEWESVVRSARIKPE